MLFDSIVWFQIAYRIARDQFPGLLSQTFLVLSDDEPQPVQLGARRLSLDPVGDPRTNRRDRGSRKHPRDPDSMSVESSSNPKKPDQTKSAEKKK